MVHLSQPLNELCQKLFGLAIVAHSQQHNHGCCDHSTEDTVGDAGLAFHELGEFVHGLLVALHAQVEQRYVQADLLVMLGIACELLTILLVELVVLSSRLSAVSSLPALSRAAAS